MALSGQFRDELAAEGDNDEEPSGPGGDGRMTARSAYHLLAKPAGAACNLGCAYCFFLSRANLYPAGESPLMPDDVPIRTMADLVRKGRYADDIMGAQGGASL